MKIKRRIKVVEVPAFYDPRRDGVTFSLLAGWLSCREKARLTLKGWTPRKTSMAMTFGSMAHAVLQLLYEKARATSKHVVPDDFEVFKFIQEVERVWRLENPLPDAEALEHLELSLMLLEAIMPLYTKHWSKDFTQTQWERVEKEFKIPLETRHGSTFFRGKMDGSFWRPEGKRPWLLETKTKARLDEGTLVDILPFELQVNIYLLALFLLDGHSPSGVLYNILRRPGLRQKKGESVKQFSERIIEDIKMRPDWYFIRMEMKVDEADVVRFQGEFEDLVGDFLDWWYGKSGHYKNSGQCENKYGTCPFLSICSQNNFVPFFKRDRVFRELEEM